MLRMRGAYLPFESSRKFLFPIENEGRDLFDEMGGAATLKKACPQGRVVL